MATANAFGSGMTARASNWGRWGASDQRGAANLVTPQLIRNAACLVRAGRVYSLGLTIDQNKMPVMPGRAPAMHFMTVDGGDFAAGYTTGMDYAFADDYLFLGCHSGTHVDALSHVWYDGSLYNGHSASSIRSYGASRCGIEQLVHLVTRGVLLDVAGYLGVPSLPRDHCISADELARCAAAQGTSIGTGDCVLIRTGWLRGFTANRADPDFAAAGIGMDAAQWLAGQDVSAVGADNPGVELTFGTAPHTPEVHKFLIRDCGTYLIECVDLEALAADSVSEFLFVIAPLRIRGGVGSPVNPLAIT